VIPADVRQCGSFPENKTVHTVLSQKGERTMPRIAGTLTPKYRKHRASGQAVTTIAGRDHYLGPWRSKASLIEYDRLISEWLAAGRPTTQAAANDLSVAELIKAYWRFAKGYYRKNGKPTGTQYGIKIALGFLKAGYGRTRAADFGPLALKALQLKMIEADQSRRYVNDNTDRIRRVFKWAAGEQLLPSSIYQSLQAAGGLRKGRTEARETAPIMPVADAVVDATIPHLPAVVADMVRLQRLTGARPGEICILRPCDVDTTGDVWKYRPETHKTEHLGRERVILIGPKGQDVLRPYLLRDKSAYCFSPADSERKRRAAAHDRRVVPLSYGNRSGTNRTRKPRRSAGDRYDVASYRRAITRAVDRVNEESPEAPLADWSPNQLRHQTATEVRRQFGLEAAQVVLGHSSADVSQIYAERDLAAAEKIMAAVG
jgi:integrase